MKSLLLLFTFACTLCYAETITLTEANSVTIRGPISAESISPKIQELNSKASKLGYFSPLYVVLYTPGGSIDAGNLFIEAAKGLNRNIHTITIFAASMGYHIAQSLGTRYIVESGVLMSHRAAIGGLGGQIPGEANSRLQWLTAMTTLMDKKVSSRVGVSLSSYQQSIVNELWLLSEDSVAKNHADKVVSIKCGKDLVEGTQSEKIQSIFGSATVTFSKCPLVPAPLSATEDKSRRQVNVSQMAVIRDFFNPMKVLNKNRYIY